MKSNITDQPDQPNIVFILTDQMRGDCLSISGHPSVETPNLDMLARKGVNFTSAYSPCPSCIAARASIWTGQRPTTHGRLGYQDGVYWRYRDTLAELLGTAGYQTHCVGKTHFFPQRMHMGFQSIDSYEASQNFDGRYVNDYYEWLKKETNGRLEERDHGVDSNSWYARPSHLPEELHNNTWVVSRGIDFLRRRDRTRPFFLNLSFHRPHPPIDPPGVFYDMYSDIDLPETPIGDWASENAVPPQTINSWRGKLPDSILSRCRKAYYAQIAHIDNQVGRLMLALREFSDRPTWFVFTSDHGEMLGDHCLFRKCYAYEGSARIPMIICPPQASGIHQNPAPVSLTDIMPTMLQIAGLDVPGSVEGRSMIPLLTKEPGDADWRTHVHGEHSPCYHADWGMQYLTDGRTKYVWYTSSGIEQLFDIENDPDELHDLSGVPQASDRLEYWRSLMIDELAPREKDGLSDGKKLVPGKRLPAVRPRLLKNESE